MAINEFDGVEQWRGVAVVAGCVDRRRQGEVLVDDPPLLERSLEEGPLSVCSVLSRWMMSGMLRSLAPTRCQRWLRSPLPVVPRMSCSNSRQVTLPEGPSRG